MRRVLATALLCLAAIAAPSAAQAQCAAPAGSESEIIYSDAEKFFQYCNGTDWISMNYSAGSGSGGCTNPVRAEGQFVYNEDHRLIQGCAGNVWRGFGPLGGAEDWVQVSVGGVHTCGIKSDGSLWCWGQNANGQLGDGGTAAATAAVAVGGDRWSAVSVGSNHTCGIKIDGSLWCWGQGSSGELGTGGTPAMETTPVQEGSASNWIAVDAGGSFTCGIKADNSLWCWGRGSNGELGNGGTAQQNSPVQESSGSTWIKVSAGWNHTCGIKVDGSAFCWGAGGSGQLGNGGTPATQTTPAAVSGGSTWIDISASSLMHSCGITSGGAAYCWGANSVGQGGTGAAFPFQLTSPTAVMGGHSWKSISTGVWHSCGVRTDDSAMCWGWNTTGQIRYGGSTVNQVSPYAVESGGTWTAVQAGGYANCGIRPDGTMECWGGVALGFPFEVARAAPAKSIGSAGWRATSAGALHSCGIRADNSAWCWGLGTNGRLGDGIGTVDYQAPVPVAGGGSWDLISAGGWHSCGIRADQSLWCWGADSTGQLGDGAVVTGQSLTPVEVSGAASWTTASAGNNHTCAIRTDGTLWCWGYGPFGQLGTGGTPGVQTTPVQESSGGTWMAVASGHLHTCGIRTDGSLWCWGSGGNGRLGNGGTAQQNSPVQESSFSTWIAVTAGNEHSCGIQTDGTLWCWGSGGNGRLGNGGTAQQTSPVQVSGGGTWTAVAANLQHTCGIKTDGTAWCWGYDNLGRLGNGTVLTADQSAPSPVEWMGGRWVSISAGGNHTCALLEDSNSYCWGGGLDGQLGDGETGYVKLSRQTWCGSPERPAATILYNTDEQVMQYCDGVSWVKAGR